MTESTRKKGVKDTNGFFQNIGPWYMLRLRFFPFWLSDLIGFNVFIHLFLHSDHDVPHDHPWASYSLLLWGKLRERRQVPFPDDLKLDPVEYETGLMPLWKWKYRSAVYRHVVLLDSKWALTIFIPQKKERSWYFYPEGKQVHWVTFLDLAE